ncbi:hypothetical protein [Legionella brunensis]|uniref:hypothetical protein n=2 Tax=Legionella brunensis TaxID=29422 RepID=UPI00104144A4|nr:hypothetical protein [Legionella brunensis]
MGKIRRAFILANGTVSITKKKPNKGGYFSFFSLNETASWLMFDPDNFINQLAEHCQEEHTLVLDGPGTDLTQDNGSLLKSISALIDGHIGDNGINANFEKIKKFIEKQSKEATKADETLIICAVGWSRGGFVLSQIKEWLEQQVELGDIKVQACYLHCIDSVVGGPTDRLRYLTKDRNSHKKTPINLEVHNYLSNTGNLNLWEHMLKYLPEKYQVNMPFFSAVIDNTKNITYSVHEKEYTHRSNSWLFPASHEALAGRPRNQIEQWSGDIVLADIIRNLAELSFKLNENWAKKMLQKGQIALEKLRQYNINLGSCRKYLDFDDITTTLFGRDSTKDDHIHSFLDIRNFS